LLTGRSVFDVEELLGLEALRPAPLRCALEVAFWDLVGRTVGQPLCHLFGGGYRRRIPLAVRLAGPAADRVAQVARELAEQGFHSQIITASGRPEDDLGTTAAVWESAGERAELRLDGAASYDLETARDLCAQLEPVGLQFFLDPLNTPELDRVVSLRRQTGVPLAVWRAIGGPADVLALIRCGAAPFVVVDPQRVGGLVPARKCAAVAEAGGLHSLLGSRPSLGIATAAMLHLAASTPAFSGCNESAYHQLQDDVLAEPLEIIDAMITVPQTPGLGIEVDRAKVERYQVS
jgi:L-alanine-DL-glutamate epimerase-like enolase superfamily enzyme